MKRILFLITLFIFFIPFNGNSFAEENDQFEVAIAPSPHQLEENLSFFDLLVEPREVIDLNLLVTNTGKEKKLIKVTPTNARTDNNGEIDYSRIKKEETEDSSLLLPFTSMVSKEQSITLDPGKSQTVSFKLKIPEEKFNGTVLGGFVISASDISTEKGKADKNNGIYIKNEYEIRKAVRIRESEENLTPEFSINNIGFEWVNNIPALTVNIQNSVATMFGNMTINATVTDSKSQKIIKKYSAENLEMAPNSNFNFPIFWYDQDIIEGNYNLSLKITSGSENWDLDKKFSITKNESSKFSDYHEKSTKSKMTWIDYLIITLIVLVILILVCIVIFLIKKNKLFSMSSKKKKSSTKNKKKRL